MFGRKHLFNSNRSYDTIVAISYSRCIHNCWIVWRNRRGGRYHLIYNTIRLWIHCRLEKMVSFLYRDPSTPAVSIWRKPFKFCGKILTWVKHSSLWQGNNSLMENISYKLMQLLHLHMNKIRGVIKRSFALTYHSLYHTMKPLYNIKM